MVTLQQLALDYKLVLTGFAPQTLLSFCNALAEPVAPRAI
jgi:hypothetical protein